VAPGDTERELSRLESDLRRLEAEYNMFFAGRLPRPPWETRSRVDAAMKRFDRTPPQNYGERFRFQTLQARFAAFADLWDRGLRARDEGGGRANRFGVQRTPAAGREEPAGPRIVHVASFTDPMQEMDKLHDLYDSLAQARREAGADNVPFHRFAELVKTQVQKMRESGGGEVAFRVSVVDGKVNFTARALRSGDEGRG
jgi:hypothetical protein